MTNPFGQGAWKTGKPTSGGNFVRALLAILGVAGALVVLAFWKC